LETGIAAREEARPGRYDDMIDRALMDETMVSQMPRTLA
jgi:hypothetical protein